MIVFAFGRRLTTGRTSESVLESLSFSDNLFLWGFWVDVVISLVSFEEMEGTLVVRCGGRRGCFSDLFKDSVSHEVILSDPWVLSVRLGPTNGGK
jgi:hypothetical protein